jgi:hypothetical protein
MPRTDENRRRKKRILRLIFALLASLLFLLILIISLLLFFPRERIKEYLQDRLARRLNSQVEIYALSVDYFPGPRLTMEGVVVNDPETSLQEFYAREVIADVNIWNFISDGNPITRLVFGSPILNLRRTREGDWNVAKATKTPEETGRKDRRQAFGPIIIRNGVIQVSEPETGRLLTVRDIVATVRLKRDLLLIESASLHYSPVYADIEGSLSNLSAPYPSVDLRTSGRILKEGPLEGWGGDKLPASAQIAAFSTTGVGQTDNVSIEGDFSINPDLTLALPTEGSLSGNLQVSDGVFLAENLMVEMGASALSLSGAAKNLWSDERAADLSGTIRILPEPMISAISKAAAERIEPDGEAGGAVSLAATMEKVDIDADLDLERAGLTVPFAMRKEVGVPGSFSVNGRYVFGGSFAVDHFDLTIQDATIGGEGRINPGGTPRAQGSLRATDFPLDRLDRIPALDFQEGNVSFEAEVSQATPQAGLSYEAEATIEEARAQARPLQEPIQELDAKLTIADQTLTAESASFLLAGSRFDLEAELADFSSPTIEGNLQTRRLDMNRLRSALVSRKSEVEEKEAGRPAGIALKILVEADSVYAGNFLTGPLSGTLQTSGDAYTFAPFALQVFEGEIRGAAEFIPAQQGALWTMNFEGRNIQLEQMMSYLELGEKQLTGTLALKATLQGSSQGGAEEILQSMTGEVEAAASNGRVSKFPVLTTIINLTQVPLGSVLIPGLREVVIANTVINIFRTGGRSLDITSVTYTSIEGEFRLSEGIAATDSVRFNSGVVNLLAEGEINYVADYLELRVSATPLGALTSLAGKIPLVGGAITGAKEAIVSTDFVVSGPLSNPTVRPALVGGLFGGEAQPPPREEEREAEPVRPPEKVAPEEAPPKVPPEIRAPEDVY